jgi:hypothetical protein
MVRSRAFVAFGGWLTVLAIASVSQRSHAAGREAPQPASPAPRLVASAQDSGPQLTPRFASALAKGDPAIFGSFIKPGSVAPSAVVDEACPANMVEVEGDYCPYVEEKCVRWLDPATKLQCAEFEKPAVAGRCFMKTERKRFCMDRYEWPNKAGELPQSMASWNDAKASCESIGKRLCSDTEWTLACEGPEHHPYPYGDGYARDGGACNMDKPYVWPNPERVYNPETSAQELARLDQREPSGARSSCVSPYGVHDMTGNVDEWVVNVSQFGQPHESGLKGGYWGPVRTRCRPMTTGHEQSFRYYQTGFRCCGAAHEAGTTDAAPLASR